MAQGLFMVGPGAGLEPILARHSQKCLRPRQHSPQTPGEDPPEGGKSLGEGHLRPKEISRYRDTLGQICPQITRKCYPAPGELQNEIDLPLWQRNISVLITVRGAHYGEMGKAPTTIYIHVYVFVGLFVTLRMRDIDVLIQVKSVTNMLSIYLSIYLSLVISTFCFAYLTLLILINFLMHLYCSKQLLEGPI